MNILFKPAEVLYHLINRLRRSMYRARIFRARRLPRPVISVGNIAIGGSGKTPAVVAICRELSNRGLRVAVLTRGYGRPRNAPDGLVTDSSADKWGDEPVLINGLAGVDVIVGADRYRNAREYLERNHCDAFILDDGFQHLQLRRDLDIVIDAPSRFAREGREALAAADIVVPRRLVTTVPEPLRGRPAFAFAGLADNEQFFDALRDGGVELRGTKGFRDHHRYSDADFEAIRKAAADLPLITSRKDAVKLKDPSIAVADAEFQFEAGVLERIAAVASGTESRRRRKKKKGLILQRVEYATYRAFARVVSAMSDAAIHRWGARLGRFARHLLRRRERLAAKNIAETLTDQSPAEQRRILTACWEHFGREVLVSLQSQNLSLEQIAERAPIENLHLVHEAIARGRGTLLISAHWGGWEIGGLSVMSAVRNVRSVARPLDNPLLERDLQKLREKTGAEVVDRRRAARMLMKSLAENAVVVLLPDQSVIPREGILIPFLGRPAWTTPAPAKLALRANATIVFAFCIPDGLRHRLLFTEAIDVSQLPETERDPETLMRRINDAISAQIRKKPELWLWMHDRWKGTGASGAADV